MLNLSTTSHNTFKLVISHELHFYLNTLKRPTPNRALVKGYHRVIVAIRIVFEIVNKK